MSRVSRRIWTGGAVLMVAAAVSWFEARERTPAAAPAAESPPVPQRAPAAADDRLPRMTRAAPAPGALPALPAPVASPHPPGSAAEREWIEQRTAELEESAWSDDPAVLEKILAELRNSVPEIRQSALQAVKSFGSREAIPQLRKLAAEARDPIETAEIQAVIEYLELPSAADE